MMTNWLPELANYPGPRYRAIADALAGDVRDGRLTPGTRLPTHRDLAWHLKVTVGTVSRAYADAERRGLIVGEVGRGTYVRPLTGSIPIGPPAESGTGVIDLTVNRPRAPSEARFTAEALGRLAADPDLPRLMEYQPPQGRPEDRAAAAQWLERTGVQTAAEQVLISASGQHAMAVVLTALTEPGDTLAVEALTYPGMRALASALRLRLLPIAIDEHGLIPEAFAAACRTTRIRGLYILPTLHNPTTATLPLDRRKAIAATAQAFDVAVIEDDVYGFLTPNPLPPVTNFAGECGFYVSSASKSMLPGLRIGFIHAPLRHVERIAGAIRATTYSATPLMARLVARWIADGTADRLVAEKRIDVAQRQEVARTRLARFAVRTDPAAAHLWLTCPEPWRADDFAEAARSRKVLVTPAAAFAVSRQPPHALRICLSTPLTAADLDRGLAILAELLEAPTEAYAPVV